MAQYKLTYFNGKGRGEVPRLIFAKMKVEYEDVRVSRDDFKEMKEKMPFGQLPVLEVDGRTIAQSYAITCFLAKRFGLFGKDEFEEARINEVMCGMEDLLLPLVKLFYETDETRKAEATKKYQEEQLPNFMGYFERLLIQNNGGDGYFVGDSMTAADLNFICYISFPSYGKVEIDWDKYPKLRDLKKRVEADEEIAKWIKNRPETEF